MKPGNRNSCLFAVGPIALLPLLCGCVHVASARLPKPSDLHVTSGDGKSGSYVSVGLVHVRRIGFSLLGIPLYRVTLQDVVDELVKSARKKVFAEGGKRPDALIRVATVYHGGLFFPYAEAWGNLVITDRSK